MIEDERVVQCRLLNIINYLINENPNLYLGISKEWFWVIDVLSIESEICTDHIKLTLMKIKLNDTFERLGE